MQNNSTLNPGARVSRCRTRLILPALVTLLFAQGCATYQQADYKTPEAAADALALALRTNDPKLIKDVLGPDASDLIDSGDEIADANAREKFLRAYDEQRKLTSTAPDSVTLEVGKDGWPLPIPIVRDAPTSGWWFDTEAGKDEVLSRRIGRNELDVIQVCQAIVDAQHEYTLLDPDKDGVHEYARKVISDAPARNGLYYVTKEGEAPSPLGDLVASAVEEGYGGTQAANAGPRPYHGYYYRLLTSQGAHAEGGAMDYVVQGRLIGGFAAVAYPAEYGDSGIMTFIVNHKGVVYQSDLGPETTRLAKAMTSFDPGKEWKAVDSASGSAAATPSK